MIIKRCGSGWVHEIKHDGYRVIARKEGDRVRLGSRHGTDFTAKFTRVAKAIGAPPVENALIDGEAVVLLNDGHSDFEALGTTSWKRHRCFGGSPLTSKPLQSARKIKV